jgi:hypothetical protein
MHVVELMLCTERILIPSPSFLSSYFSEISHDTHPHTSLKTQKHNKKTLKSNVLQSLDEFSYLRLELLGVSG